MHSAFRFPLSINVCLCLNDVYFIFTLCFIFSLSFQFIWGIPSSFRSIFILPFCEIRDFSRCLEEIPKPIHPLRPKYTSTFFHLNFQLDHSFPFTNSGNVFQSMLPGKIAHMNVCVCEYLANMVDLFKFCLVAYTFAANINNFNEFPCKKNICKCSRFGSQ